MECEKMIKAGLQCSFMTQNTINKGLRQIENVRDVLTVKDGYPRNWPILSIQFCKLTGYYHTKYTI